MTSPITQAKVGAISVCGKLLQRGKPIVVSENLVDKAAKYFEEHGMIRILPVSAGTVQIFMV